MAASASLSPSPLSPLPFSKLLKYPSLPHTITRSPPPPTIRRFTRYPPHLRIQQFSCCLALDRKDDDLPTSTIRPPAGDDLRVVFAGGGTGGHLFPAIAIADALKNTCPTARILFLGTESGIERNAVPSAGYEFSPIPAVRLVRPIIAPQNLLLPFHLLQSMAASWKILREFGPHIVVGTGAYVSAPVCFAAALARMKLVIQEQNFFPGITNQALAPYAERVFLAFHSCVKYFPKEKCVVSGNPVRLSLLQYVSKAVARSHFFSRALPKAGDEKAQVVLVLGGSAGSNAINITVLNLYYEMLLEHKNRFIIWQTGAEGYNEMESLVKNHRRLLVIPFLERMDLAYAAADVVVSRAGAMTCTEILTTAKPSIMIPSPTSAEDHQTKNAYIMADIAGSKVLTEDELDSSSLEIAIDEVLGDENLMTEMSEKAMKYARPNAATDIAQCILSLVKLSSTVKE